MKSLLLATAVFSCLAFSVYAQSLERIRLKEQPHVGQIIDPNDYSSRIKCEDGKKFYLKMKTSRGTLLFVTEKDFSPYLEMNEDGTIKQKPLAFSDGKNVYVSLLENGKFDFNQYIFLEDPCEVLEDLDKYVLKD